MHASVYNWAVATLPTVTKPYMVQSVLEVGSQNVNGSLRDPIHHLYSPLLYIGTDMVPGPGVDVVIEAASLDAVFRMVFDLVICTEMLEHAEDWRESLASMVNCIEPGGWLLLTTRGPGFPRHDHPADYWRFTPDMMDRILLGLNMDGIVRPDPDPHSPGVVCLVQKRGDFIRTEDNIPDSVVPERVT